VACGTTRPDAPDGSPASLPPALEPGAERKDGDLRPVAARPEVRTEEAPVAPSPAPAETPKRVLSHAASSDWELCEWVLQALKEKDSAKLEALRITREEYEKLLWPEFKIPANGGSIDFHWMLLDLKSRAGIQDAINEFGGEEMKLLEVVPTKALDPYETYELWPRVEFKVRRANGTEEQIRVLHTIVHLDGQFKILGFPS
jgi:hypothetical protein